jgi:hypothetical protein
MEWKVIGLSAFINAVLTTLLSIYMLPFIFAGPFIGGFLAAYLSRGYEDNAIMDKKDGAVLGAVSGLLGGFIITLFFILGFGTIGVVIKSVIGNIGNNPIILAYIILQLSVIMSFIFGLFGGIVGVFVKDNM